MNEGLQYIKIPLNGSGAGSGIIPLYGQLTALRVQRSGGSPAVTVADVVDTFLNNVTVAADATYHIKSAATLNDGTTTASSPTPLYCAGNVTITVASGAASGYVEVYFKVVKGS